MPAMSRDGELIEQVFACPNQWLNISSDVIRSSRETDTESNSCRGGDNDGILDHDLYRT